MRIFTVQVLLAGASQAYASELAMNLTSNIDSVDNLADKLVNSIAEFALKASCFHYTDLRTARPGVASRLRCGRLIAPPVRAVGIHEAQEVISNLAEGIGLPCTVLNCRDQIYTSTLDRDLRGEIIPFITTPKAAIFGSLGLYTTITPGVLPGLFDFFIIRPLLGAINRRYTLDDYVLGKKLGEGGFGAVYEATGVQDGKQYVLKRAADFGEAEIWMNQRLQIAAPRAVAPFVTAFEGPDSKGSKLLWLVWKLEGKQTLFKLMQDKTFPYNVEPFLFKGGEVPGNLPMGTERKARIIAEIFDQVLGCLRAMHATGIVHRDIKPENIIFDDEKGVFKLIDLGAAADLRFGVNYSPKDFLFDPRYKAPEEYIMSKQTPEAPVLPIALGLSPILWQLNLPDRFDIYSTGVTLLQLTVPMLRNDDNLVKFRKDLRINGNDLTAWRSSLDARKREQLDVLDFNERAGWRLVKQLMATDGSKRPSALAAQGSSFVQGKNAVLRTLEKAFPLPDEDGATQEGFDELGKWIYFKMIRSGTKKYGGFASEAELLEMREASQTKKQSDDAKPIFGRQTILGNVGNSKVGKKLKLPGFNRK